MEILTKIFAREMEVVMLTHDRTGRGSCLAEGEEGMMRLSDADEKEEKRVVGGGKGSILYTFVTPRRSWLWKHSEDYHIRKGPTH